MKGVLNTTKKKYYILEFITGLGEKRLRHTFSRYMMIKYRYNKKKKRLNTILIDSNKKRKIEYSNVISVNLFKEFV